MASQLFIGLMSGTSLDGVDVALVTFDHLQHPQLLKTHFTAYPTDLRNQILALQHPTDNELEITALMGNTLARLYAKAVNELLSDAEIDAGTVTAIGCHGQTIRHRPELGYTMQIGNAALLSELTGITVVSDFRSRDIAANGQGAPLVPAFHQDVFAHNQRNRAIINIGGIANITYLSNTGEVFGFDSGPGNMLLDAWTKQHLGLDYDTDGQWSSTGNIIEPLLSAMLSEPYFSALPPKSTGRDLFNDAWLNHCLTTQTYAPNDVARTLVALSAHSIANAVKQYCGQVDEIYLCGGGAKNKLLTSGLQSLIGSTHLETTEKLGMGVDWVEAIAFAWLAKKCLSQESANLPEVTGAKGLRILGAIYQA
ncbi:MAG: anhydro-N-acetylmuramic acid kinase [Methylotenera sp.]|uniref:anhydro-N-acetylmuramic acid kinase n=1 Tax=Methylotenera sp. TaxID=2051956 RepID=UPI0027267609|nr:anhydro-N-acetylmuramic acid kinase [Methylotenera sp.]MDO9151224.1 anhydro-N-acetylmuramic acid kinase [Methylotenera sp.]